MNLTKNFTLEEFIYSEIAIKNKIKNEPDYFETVNIKELAKNIMQPLREHFAQPVFINSGFRCKKLNKIVGGASSSQHTTGEACDFIIKGIKNKEACLWIKDNLPFDQLILEPSWIHVSYRKANRADFIII